MSEPIASLSSPSAQGHRILGHLARVPTGAWQVCKRCRAYTHRDALLRAHGTCAQCGGNLTLGAHERVTALTDPGSFVEHLTDLASTDPLTFTDRLPYLRRLQSARNDTGLVEAAVTGVAAIGGTPIVLVVLDFAFLGGSMGAVVGEKVAWAAGEARERGVPLIVVAASGGARMQEGAVSLFQMARTAAAFQQLRDSGTVSIVVLCDPLFGGVAASFAALGDITLIEEGARAGFAGQRVIEQTIRQKLPPAFQTAKFLFDHGHVDRVVRRAELRPLLQSLLTVATGGDPRSEQLGEGAAVSTPASAEAGTAPVPIDAWEAAQRARAQGRPTTQEYVAALIEGFVELHGDGWQADDQAVLAGIGLLGGRPVAVVGHRKARDTAGRLRCNFGMAHPAGYRKAMRVFALAERWGIPVLTLVDTPGAYPGVDAEEHNQSRAIAESMALLTRLRTAVVSVVIGEGGSGGALALAVADCLLIQENAVLSVISPEGAASILYGHASSAPEAARSLRATAPDLLSLGLVDRIVPEPAGGADTDPEQATSLLAAAVATAFAELRPVPPDELVRRRQERLRHIGDVALTWGQRV